MFKISQSQTYKWTVTVYIPVDGNKHDKQTFDGEFKRLPQSRLKEIPKQIDSGELIDTDFAKEVLVGWKGITDDNGDEVPFSEAARERLLDVPLVATAVVKAYFESMSGAKIKN